MKISICILTYKRLGILKELIKSLKCLQYNEHEIIVVDNHSEDGTGEFVKENYPDIIYYCTNRNIGVAARNVGINRASGDLIITIDDDISGLNDIHLNNINRYFEENESVGALNFKVIDSKSGEVCNWIHHRKSEEYSDKEFDTYEITEGAVVFRMKALEKAGLYPEHFFISHEGPDMAFRILNTGYEVKYSGLVTVIHAHAQEGRKPWYRYYYDTRNQFYLANRSMPAAYAIMYLLRGSLSLLIYSIRDGFFGYWCKGIIDGLKGVKKYSYERHILSASTMKKIRLMDSHRPSLIYMAMKRLFRKEVRL
jgi:GT2 family glycosyltransferase